MTTTFYVQTRCPSSSLLWLFRDMVIDMLEKKLLVDCHLFNVGDNLLIYVYVHNILPPFHLHLALSFVVPCPLVHMFVFFNNTYNTQPLVFQIWKLDGLS